MSNKFAHSSRRPVKAAGSTSRGSWGVGALDSLGCPSILDMGGFLDGTMTDRSRRKAMEEHLSRCAVCRGEIVDLYLLLRAPKVQAPADLVRRLLDLLPLGGDCPAMP